MTPDSVPQDPSPAPTEAEIAAVLRDAFGIDGRLTRLDGEHDINWRVDHAQGAHIAKVSVGTGIPGQHELQESLLAHIHRTDPDLRVPMPVRAANGAKQIALPGHVAAVLRVFSFIEGKPLRNVPKSSEVLEAVGRHMGRLTLAMQGFGHPAAHRDGFPWSLDNAGDCDELVASIEDSVVRQSAARALARWRRHVEPVLPSLPAMVVHHDANDDNVLVNVRDAGPSIGLVDFGDAVFARRINELAVTLAYALMGTDNIPSAARDVVRGYSEHVVLSPQELSVLYDLVGTRLAVSLCMAAKRSREAPDYAYYQVSRDQAAELLRRLEDINPRFFTCLVLAAAGHAPVASRDEVVCWLEANQGEAASVFPFDLATTPRMTISLAAGAPGTEHASDAAAYGRWLEGRMRETGARYAIGLYGERRDCYTTEQFHSAASDEARSVHLGIDLFVPAGTPVQVPLAGRVLAVQDNDRPLDYGPTVIVEHQCGPGGAAFWTLYGHLSRETLTTVAPGELVQAGQAIGSVGSADVNGGWTPHLHFQVITDLLGETGNFNGAGEPGNMDVWRAICPDPNLVLGLAPETFEAHSPPEALQARRERLLGPSLGLSYRHKLEIVRGRGSWLFDHTGRAYLDCVNNICHVGHCHPRVVKALHAQATTLNTNTRYLHPNIVEYAERLLATFPDPLSVCFFVCSGSEANELALRLARTATGRHDLLALDWAYHGNTGGLIDISPYKFNRAGGQGRPDYVDIAELPDPYRGRHKGYGEETARAYAESVEAAIEACRSRTGEGPAAMIAEALPGCAGQIIFPERYLHHAFERVRGAGGLCIADEVQTGFGRVGETMWAFELQEVVPDIVTLGKPIGNGHPMAAVVTTREIADAFANGMEYFNSFGGNPVSCAVGGAVLDVIEAESLQERARITGNYLLERFKALGERHPIIGDVRGRGMFIGIELVANRETLEPATDAADRVVNRLREDGVLLSTDGPYDNVLKLKPPLAFGTPEAELLCRKLDEALSVAERR